MSSAMLFTPIVAFFFFKYKINKSKTSLVEDGINVLRARV